MTIDLCMGPGFEVITMGNSGPQEFVSQIIEKIVKDFDNLRLNQLYLFQLVIYL